VFINPDILKTATFLVVNSEPVSTVFFIGWPLSKGSSAYYAATTYHSVKNSKASIRFNRKEGRPEDIPFLPQDWVKHPLTDVAVLPLEIPLDKYDIEFIEPHKIAESMDFIRTHEIPKHQITEGLAYGTGDEVYSVGLFGGHHGEDLAQSVARFGHIAMKPEQGEKIFAEIDPPPADLVPIDAFLVEIAAWEGQSGSPVFLRTNVNDYRWQPVPGKRPLIERNYLIGMMQGFYPGKQGVRIDGNEATLEPLNMGIAIVIPAPNIMEVLMKKELENRRESMAQGPKVRPSRASISSEQSTGEAQDITPEGFEDALRRASRKISSPDE
jgi:hypothetical protein